MFANRWPVWPELQSSVTLTEASASTAQLGYWSAEGNCLFINVRMNSGKRPSMMLCLTDRMRVSCKNNKIFESGLLIFSGHSSSPLI